MKAFFLEASNTEEVINELTNFLHGRPFNISTSSVCNGIVTEQLVYPASNFIVSKYVKTEGSGINVRLENHSFSMDIDIYSTIKIISRDMLVTTSSKTYRFSQRFN